ncbi:hypothetical protein V5O48_000885 [Marasmius crinis-equi]|uniref:Uncharacterized protein n=1 Tax=Marasmius crinis-equi TaxID=585013 RepID=A0ABR3FZU1_9AGAR
MDPLLLTPEDANRPIPLPNEVVSEATRNITVLSSSTPIPRTPITIQLPDEELPLGFVPMTPMIRSPQLTPVTSSRSPPRSRASSRPSSPRHDDQTQSGFFSPIPSLAQFPSPPSPPTRPATASGTTRPPLSLVPTADGGASRALSGPPGAPQDAGIYHRTTSPIQGVSDGFVGWASPAPSHSSFMRPPASVFGDED